MDDISKIKEKRDQILTAEIGALLHDIGKCHPYFIESQSIDKGGEYKHTEIKKIMDDDLIALIRSEKFRIEGGLLRNSADDDTEVYHLITRHHNMQKSSEVTLLSLLGKCDRLDSADDKGIVRKKQPADNTIISSPFGYPRERVDPQCLKQRFDDLNANLKDLLRAYVQGDISILFLRRNMIPLLETTFKHALGETRIPANDVTLWDHSYSTASRFKSIICEGILGEPSNDNPQWRIIGFCWDGEGFINSGRKIADILTRERIIGDIKAAIKRKFEEEIPVGNVIYEDINGVYITFPSLDRDRAEKFAAECALEGYELIREMSDNEIWPFVTLSKSSRSLMILTSCLEFAAEKRNIPRRSPTLFFKGKNQGKTSIHLECRSGPHDDQIGDGMDICPVCRLRGKPHRREICGVCAERRRGRLDMWLQGEGETVWIDEVADENNRIALITLKFNLYRWLDGTMLKTLYSQTLEEWYEHGKKIKKNQQFMEKIKKSLKKELKGNSPIDLAEYLMEYFVREAIKDPDFKDSQDKISLRAKVFNTFFEDIKISEKKKNKNKSSLVGTVWNNLKKREGTVDSRSILTSLFTQNPSPARLYRIWNETREFLDLLRDDVADKVYASKWKRLRFRVEHEKLKDALNGGDHERRGFLIKVSNLEPEHLLVFHDSSGEFFTIESLSKYRFNGKKGEEAVREALKRGISWLSPEDNPGRNILNGNNTLTINNVEEEEYAPIIKIKGSPTLLQIIVPASDSMRIINLIMCLYNEKFRRVIGKLPLNIGLIVAKRKFPLYMLLDAGERLLHGEEFIEPYLMNPWWDLFCMESDPYYGFYPASIKDEYRLRDLKRLSFRGLYSLQPGYFDFEMLSSTDDRYMITYNNGRRSTREHKLYSSRPLQLHRILDMVRLWDIIRTNLSNSAMNRLEENLTSRLREWRNVRDPYRKSVFEKFALASLRDAFNEKWEFLDHETREFIVRLSVNGFLLDTMVLFRHMLKEDGNET